MIVTNLNSKIEYKEYTQSLEFFVNYAENNPNHEIYLNNMHSIYGIVHYSTAYIQNKQCLMSHYTKGNKELLTLKIPTKNDTKQMICFSNKLIKINELKLQNGLYSFPTEKDDLELQLLKNKISPNVEILENRLWIGQKFAILHNLLTNSEEKNLKIIKQLTSKTFNKIDNWFLLFGGDNVKDETIILLRKKINMLDNKSKLELSWLLFQYDNFDLSNESFETYSTKIQKTIKSFLF